MRLFIICGLDSRVSPNIMKVLNEKFSKFAFFLSFPSSSSLKNDKYNQTQIDTMISSVCDFIYSKRDSLPSSITIIYAPHKSQQILISKCFIFAHLVCCKYSNLFDIDLIKKDICDVIINYKPPVYKNYKYLPIYNFLINHHELYDIFLKYFLGELTEKDLDQYFVLKSFNCTNFPNFLKGKTKKKFYVDKRNLIFPPCRTNENHGNVSEKREGIFYLTSFYRFGILKGAGFHYDVQYAKTKLGHLEFKCTQKGEVISSNETHANIYINDVVRFPSK